MDLINQYNERLRAKYLAVADTGCRKFDFLGGRRSGKSYLIEQILLGRMLKGEVVNVATMTAEQGRLGVYADVCDIIDGSPTMQPWVEIQKAPRQVNCKANRGRMFFNTYPDPERAKGIACDWLYINEANNFTEKQYTDLSASVRRGTFCDRNPNTECWTERNGFALIHSTWKDNDYLTEEQLAWFAKLKEKAESPNATAADWYFYSVYYLGEYADMQGDIFTPDNLHFCKPEDVPPLDMVVVFSDPSARVGGDFHATVMAGLARQAGKIYILQTDSRNIGTDYEMAMMLKALQYSRDRVRVYIETNGLGEAFYIYCRNSGMQVQPHNSRANKVERIMANFHTITDRVVFVEHDGLEDFMQQIYTFDGYAEKCEHDDNIDAVNSAVTILKPYIKYSVL